MNGASKSYQGSAVKDEVDTDRDSNKIGPGCMPSCQQVDPEYDRDESRKDRPSPPWELNSTGPSYAEKSSHDKQCSEHHGDTFRSRVRMADQKVSDYAAENRIQEVHEESSPRPGLKGVNEPHYSADGKNPTQRQDGEGGCGLRFADTHYAEKHQENAGYEKSAPRFPDLSDAGCEQTRNVAHLFSPFAVALLRVRGLGLSS
jgi:hypothetical protein